MVAATLVVVVVVIVAGGGWLWHAQGEGQQAEASDLAPLRRLWKEASVDNLLTTEGRWSTEPRMTTSDGFKVHGVEGYIHTFRTPAPSCMTPLVRFERVKSGGGVDHATTGDPAWTEPGGAPSGYERRATQGYVYSPDTPPPPGTKPLYRLYNERRGDYFTTTDPAWAGPVGLVVQKGYVVERLEGYVLTDRVAAPPRCRSDRSRA